MCICFVAGAPDCVDKLLVGKHFAGMLNENAQDIVFRRRQGNRLPIDHHFPPGQVHEQTVSLIDRFAFGKG